MWGKTLIWKWPKLPLSGGYSYFVLNVNCVVACSEMDLSLCKMLLQWDKMILFRMIPIALSAVMGNFDQASMSNNSNNTPPSRHDENKCSLWSCLENDNSALRGKNKHHTEHTSSIFFSYRAAFNSNSVHLINIVPRLWDCSTLERVWWKTVFLSVPLAVLKAAGRISHRAKRIWVKRVQYTHTHTHL